MGWRVGAGVIRPFCTSVERQNLAKRLSSEWTVNGEHQLRDSTAPPMQSEKTQTNISDDKFSIALPREDKCQ